MGHAKTLLAALASGLLFGAGLAVSGMTDATRVLGFLDIAGAWDARLMFVLGGAVLTTALLFRPVLARGRPVLAQEFRLADAKAIDARLLIGAALFGIGWGLVGLCPGPALAGLGVGAREALLFVPSMLAGMLLHHRLTRT